MIENSGGSSRLFVGIAVVLALFVGVAPAVSAVGGAAGVTQGGETTVNVVVENATGGVGSAELRVAAVDPGVAITGVEFHGGPAGSLTEFAEDNSSVDVSFAAADTDDAGTVTFLTVTLDGESDISLAPRAGKDAIVVYKESGAGYEVTSVDGASITVADRHSTDDGSAPDENSDGASGDGDDPSDDDGSAGGGSGGGGGADYVAEATPASNDDGMDTTDVSSTTETVEQPPSETTVAPTASPTEVSSTATAAATAEPTTHSQSQTRMPGFTLVTVLLALLVVGLIAVRRR